VHVVAALGSDWSGIIQLQLLLNAGTGLCLTDYAVLRDYGTREDYEPDKDYEALRV
jgi:hypothetical protein